MESVHEIVYASKFKCVGNLIRMHVMQVEY